MASVINGNDDSGVVEVCTSGQPREPDSDLIDGEGKFVLKIIVSKKVSP